MMNIFKKQKLKVAATPDEVRGNEDVIRAYLGTSH